MYSLLKFALIKIVVWHEMLLEASGLNFEESKEVRHKNAVGKAGMAHASSNQIGPASRHFQ